jgi:hypothetical protein
VGYSTCGPADAVRKSDEHAARLRANANEIELANAHIEGGKVTAENRRFSAEPRVVTFIDALG